MAIARIGVVGSGTMGGGIAQVAAQAGCDVLLYDIADDLLARSIGRIRGFLQHGVERGRMMPEAMDAILARLHATTKLDDLAAVPLVIEAAPEDLALKQRLFADLDRLCADATILASNTSSLAITALGGATGRADRVVGMHFFNPAPLLPLVEVVRGAATGAATVETVADCARAWGKTPVTVTDTPGFIVNRVARPFYGEAFRLLGEGIADAATVDAVVRMAGFRMGPFALMDLIGVDVNFAVTQSVYQQTFGEPRYRPHLIQQRMVAAGRLGQKTGRGFYHYENGARIGEEHVDDTSPDLVALGAGGAEAATAWIREAAQRPDLPDLILPRILCALVNEAAFALGEGVATAADIDLAMRLGTNYPHGPLAWGEAIGLANVAAVLDALFATYHEERYRVAPLLRRRLRIGKKTF